MTVDFYQSAKIERTRLNSITDSIRLSQCSGHTWIQAVRPFQYSTPGNTALSVGSEEGLLSRDRRFGERRLRCLFLTRPRHGTFGCTGMKGEFFYTPNDGFVGEDSFTYQIVDGKELSAPITVTIVVGNDSHVENPEDSEECDDLVMQTLVEQMSVQKHEDILKPSRHFLSNRSQVSWIIPIRKFSHNASLSLCMLYAEYIFFGRSPPDKRKMSDNEQFNYNWNWFDIKRQCQAE